jgi:hypothetical protein
MRRCGSWVVHVWSMDAKEAESRRPLGVCETKKRRKDRFRNCDFNLQISKSGCNYAYSSAAAAAEGLLVTASAVEGVTEQ